MEKKQQYKQIWPVVIRWTARIVALFFVIMIVGIFIGESSGHPTKTLPLQPRDYWLLSLMGLYVAGLLLGLVWEGLGGLLSLVFLISQIISLWVGGVVAGPYFYLMAIPSLLLIISWYVHCKYLKGNEEAIKE